MKVIKAFAEITVFLYMGRLKKYFKEKKMLEYFSIFQDRKNVVEHNCYLEDYKCHILVTHTLIHTTQWHMHVYQT